VNSPLKHHAVWHLHRLLSMTMMSIASSGSSSDEQESTRSSKSRKSLESSLSNYERTRDLPSDLDDMPSLSSFRNDDMTASIRDDMSLPSLSSFRMDDLSMSSSYHSTTNHTSECGSQEGWSSFNSGNASQDTSESGEFAMSSSSSAAPSTTIERPEPPPRTVSLPIPRRTRSPVDESTSESSKLRSKAPLRGKATAVEPAIEGSISFPRRPTRTVSPMSIVQSVISDDAIKEAVNYAPRPPVRRAASPPIRDESPPPKAGISPQRLTRLPNKGAPISPTRSAVYSIEQDVSPSKRAISPPERSVSPAPAASVPAPTPPSRDLERSGSLPFSALTRPTKATRDGSSSSIIAKGSLDGSSSSLKGGDSLPRIPWRRSATESLIEDAPLTQDNSEEDGQLRKFEQQQQPSKPDEAKKAACEKNRKSPTSVRSIEESRLYNKSAAEKSPPASSDECTADTKLTEKDSKNSSLCSQDESSLREKKELTQKTSSTEFTSASNTEEEVGADEQVDGEKKEKKQGRLKKMSNSFKSIGKGSSFRHSFKAIGKTASKLKKRRKDEATGTKSP
jgi:hypothetical protein